MSERTTAEIVADLRLHSNLHPLLLVAADRLEALDAENDAFHDLAEFDALRPPCPTCGGTRIDSKLTPVQMVGFCPDCSDGRVPWERLVNVFNAVFQDWPEEHLPTTIVHLRGIR